MTKAGHTFTAGPWMAAAGPTSVVGWPVVGPMGRSICNVSWMPKKAYPDVSDADYGAFNAECEANARLIAEAGTVAHETGLTPRQLAKQRDDLLAALEELASLTKRMAALHPSRDLREVLPDPAGLALRIRALIAKATAGGAV